jgi:glycogen phosphorylase
MSVTQQEGTVAYFSMEVGLESSIPTYAGGLGVLAGDTLRAAADLGVPMVGVTLLYRNGYFRQHLDAQGNQTETQTFWTPEEMLEHLPPRVKITIEGRRVWIRAWRHYVQGIKGVVPVYFLDTALPENSSWDQTITDYLYGGDDRYRLCQEVVLGLGGMEMLRALGYNRIEVYHMNEGHSALLAMALLEQQTRKAGLSLRNATPADREAVRRRCVFTTHTPVPAGHDKFPLELVQQVLGDDVVTALKATECCSNNMLNITFLALAFSHYVNGVAMRHGEISRDMFPTYPINSITNGVHAVTWTSFPFQELFDRHMPEWRHDNLYLRYACSIPLDEIEEAHFRAKRSLIEEVERRTGTVLDEAVLTIGFARRATAYKRADLLFSDLDRLRAIASQVGPLQIVYAGKAHPHDESGHTLIRRVFEAAAALRDTIKVVYLEEYDMDLGRFMCGGVDLWLNTPRKPYEASGTSGMKAALNGVPSLSVLDGWWVEGLVEGVTGWGIGDGYQAESDESREVASLYEKLEKTVLPLYYQSPTAYTEMRRSAIALNGSFYNSQRMLAQYLGHAYGGVLEV